MARQANCVVCREKVDRYEFPARGNICFDCELSYNGYLGRRGSMIKQNDAYRAATHSGNFPLTFNFVFLRDGRYIQCSYCGIFVYYRTITRDHVYPKSRGGILKAPACTDCNVAKENMLPIEWAIYASKYKLDVATIPIGAEFMQSEVELLPKKKEMLRQIHSIIMEYIYARVV